MKKFFLFIIIFVIWCNATFAKVGDMYGCSMTQLVETNNEGNTNYQLQNFKFKREKKIIIFGSSGFFTDNKEPVLYSLKEYFYGGNDYGRFIYREGKFIYSQLLNHPEAGIKIVSIIATCEIF